MGEVAPDGPVRTAGHLWESALQQLEDPLHHRVCAHGPHRNPQAAPAIGGGGLALPKMIRIQISYI